MFCVKRAFASVAFFVLATAFAASPPAAVAQVATPLPTSLPSAVPSAVPSAGPTFGPTAQPSARADGAPRPRALAGATSPAKPAPDSTPADFDKFVKGAEKQPGLFNVWHKDGKVYLEVADDQLDRDYLEHIVPANGLGGFGFHSGDQFTQDARILRFHDTGKAVALVWPHTRFLAQPGTSQAVAVHESTADSVDTVLPVAAENKASKTRLLDLSPLLGDLLDLGNQLSDAVDAKKEPQGAYRLDPSRSYFGESKAFPKNVIVEADQTFASAKPNAINTVPDARFVQMRVKYNFSEILSTPDYMPRLYDDRVGFWEDPHVAFDDDSRRDNHRWYLLRWNVQASDPAQKLSPAKKPIVFYLDNSIPAEYRAAVRDGILEWNKAYERIGISNAVQVLDPPADGSWDPDDIRYSVVRWITDDPSEFGAEAQIVWDPRTGEIFRGGVLLDSNLGRNAKFSAKLLSSIIGSSAGADAIVPEPLQKTYRPAHDETAFGTGLALESAFGSTALALMGGGDTNEYVRQLIKAVTLHEVGHDFGLSHNFIAHNAYSAADLKSSGFTHANGTSASVMDYWPVNVWSRGTSNGTYYPIALGPYDYHAIHWGYAPIPGAKTPQDEVATLDRWASSSVDPKYAFAGDEDGFYDGHAIDPRVAPFVLSDRPMEWCGTQLELSKRLIAGLDRRFPEPQHPWEEERVAFLALASRYNTCAQTFGHYIGGEYVNRGRIGDPGVTTALTPVPRDVEVRAYAMLAKYVLAKDVWKLSPATLNRLVYTEYMPFANFGYEPQPRHDVPVVQLIATTQNRVLGLMYSPLVLQRLADLPLKSRPGQTMTLADLFTWTQAAVFDDVASPGTGSNEVHRNLQRRYARMLAQMVTSPAAGTPLDAQALARLELENLSVAVRHGLSRPRLDLQTRAHLAALQVDVRRALDARTVLPVAMR